MWRVSSGIAALVLLLLFTNRALAECPKSLVDQIKPKTLDEYVKVFRENARVMPHHSGTHPPEELGSTVNEDLQSFVRTFWMDPRGGGRGDPHIEAYYGIEYSTKLPEIFVLPADDRIMCVLMPGTVAFLSDSITHHYAVIYKINQIDQTITLLDPWASVSFLRAGHNVAGVKASDFRDDDGVSFLVLTIPDFLRVFHGLITLGPFSGEFFRTVEDVYPELAHTEDYLFWKRSRLYSTGSLEYSFESRLDNIKGPASSKLALLNNFFSDLNVGLPTDFSAGFEDKNSRSDGERMKAKGEFLLRLDEYARDLPWALRWQLLDRTRLNSDPTLRTKVADALIRADPADIDFQIRRAEDLLRSNQPQLAATAVQRGVELWGQEVDRSVDVHPTDAAIEYLLSNDWGLMTTDLIQWRYARLQLLKILVQMRMDGVYRPNIDLEKLINSYPKGGLVVDFTYEVLWILRDAKNSSLLENILELAVKIAEAKKRPRIEDEIYRFFTELLSVKAVSPELRSNIANLHVGEGFCDMAQDNTSFSTEASPTMIADAKSMCDEHDRQDVPTTAASAAVSTSAPPIAESRSPPPDPLKLIAGQWRFPNGRACEIARDDVGPKKMGVVTTDGTRLRFEWYLGTGAPNIAIERIYGIHDNVIDTLVESDENTPHPEVGQKMRYVVTPDSWTSENISTHQTHKHLRC